MECLWALERHSAVSKEFPAFLESWPWQEKEEQPQAVEIETKEEENLEEDGFIDRESIMECLWALERHSAVSKKVQAFLEFWLWQEKEEEAQPVEIESKEEEYVEENGFIYSQSPAWNACEL